MAGLLHRTARDASSTLGARAHILSDGAHVALQFDDAGSLTNRFLWGPQLDQLLADDRFGNIVADTNPALRLLSGYTGREFETEIGLQYNRARWYDPRTGQFVAVDPIRDGLNWYGYVSNRPLTRTDPSGLSAVGHHWIPVAVMNRLRDKISDAAYEVGWGAVSGPTYPPHGYETIDTVKHSQYNL